MAHKAQQDLRAQIARLQGQLARQERKAYKVRSDQLAHKVFREFRANKVCKALQGQRVRKVR
jgi:hypothetical protein